MNFEEIVSKVLEMVEQSEKGLLITVSVLLLLIYRKLSKINAKISDTEPAAEPVTAPVKPEPTKEQKKELKTLKQSFRDRMNAAVDLYFSEKSDEELTDDEKNIVSSIDAIMEVKNVD